MQLVSLQSNGIYAIMYIYTLVYAKERIKNMQFREVPNFPDYEVSTEGIVRFRRKQVYKNRFGVEGSHEIGTVLHPFTRTNKQVVVTLFNEQRGKTWLLHRLVWETYRGSTPNYIYHLDGNMDNNELSNLAERQPEFHRLRLKQMWARQRRLKKGLTNAE